MIKLQQVAFHYKNFALHFDLQVAQGERVALVGASGSGKSSLLNLVAGFIFAEQGEIWLNGQNHSHTQPYERPVSMLFQENNLFNHLTVWQNIALGLKLSKKCTALQAQKIEQAAEAVGLGHFLQQRPAQLSGGQKQRVALARCLLREQPILLLDEPFSALDPDLRQEMSELVDQLCVEKGLTLLLVTHQVQELAGKIDRIVRIENGQICL